MLKVGDRCSKSFLITEEKIQAFGDLSGDHNPVHFDDEYAATTQFKKRIAHGFLSVIVASGVFGTEFPGEGTIYLNQETKFVAPVYIDDEVELRMEVLNIDKDTNRAIIKTDWLVGNKPVIVGTAKILIPFGDT